MSVVEQKRGHGGPAPGPEDSTDLREGAPGIIFEQVREQRFRENEIGPRVGDRKPQGL